MGYFAGSLMAIKKRINSVTAKYKSFTCNRCYTIGFCRMALLAPSIYSLVNSGVVSRLGQPRVAIEAFLPRDDPNPSFLNRTTRFRPTFLDESRSRQTFMNKAR